MTMTKPNLLIIEDDDLQYEIYEESLSDYRLTRALNGSDALAKVPKNPPSLLILDHVLAGGELGLEFLPEFKELMPHVPIIIVSGALEVRQQMAALQGPRRAHYCLPKPVDIRELKRTIAIALKECSDTEIIRQFESRSQQFQPVAIIGELLFQPVMRQRAQSLPGIVKSTSHRHNPSCQAGTYAGSGREFQATPSTDVSCGLRRWPGGPPNWQAADLASCQVPASASRSSEIRPRKSQRR